MVNSQCFGIRVMMSFHQSVKHQESIPPRYTVLPPHHSRTSALEMIVDVYVLIIYSQVILEGSAFSLDSLVCVPAGTKSESTFNITDGKLSLVYNEPWVLTSDYHISIFNN